MPRDRIGLHGEREVLVHTRVVPPDTFGIGIIRCERRHRRSPSQLPDAAFSFDLGRSAGPRPRTRALSTRSPATRSAALGASCGCGAIESPATHGDGRRQPLPGRMPSVRHAEMTKCPMRVLTRTSPPTSMPSASASDGWIHSGWRWLISASHLAFAERVCISVGIRNVGNKMRSLPARSSRCQWT